MYHALYRKYRPIIFDDVVGQQTIVKTLKNSIINKNFSHAYMFFGPRGTGKTTVSKIFARSINCLDNDNGNSCGKCKNCINSYEKECVDIIEIDAASNNGVDEIRELKNKISLVPAELKYKVYIIDEVHMLSTGAFNALLKTLEEPPEHAIFILATTDQQKVPETIISRCQCFSFQRIPENFLVERMKKISKLENISVSDDVLVEIAILSDGGMRDSLGMLDKLNAYVDGNISIDDFVELNGLVSKKELSKILDYVENGYFKECLQFIDSVNSKGQNLIQVLLQFMYYLRNFIVSYYVDGHNDSINIDLCQKLLNKINENLFNIKKSSNPKISIEMLFIEFINNNQIISNNFNEKLDKKDDLEINTIKEKTIENNDLDSVEENDDYNKIVNDNLPLNFNEIMSIRVNNTFAKANKNVLKEELANLEKLRNHTFDQKIGYLVCGILDSTFRVASDDNIVISYEYDSIAKQNQLNIDLMSDVYYNITGSKKSFAIITDDKWNEEKKVYISNLQSGVKYDFIEEPEEVFEEIENNDIIDNDAIKLFGDIVEID